MKPCVLNVPPFLPFAGLATGPLADEPLEGYAKIQLPFPNPQGSFVSPTQS